MKIEKNKGTGWFDYGYRDSQTNGIIYHGLDNYSWFGIGYNYHNIEKGFWLKYKNWL